VILYTTGVLGGKKTSAQPAPSGPTASAPAPGTSAPTATNGKSPVAGTINDTQTGLSYPRLGASWQLEAFSPGNSRGFSRGEESQVMANYQNGTPYLATAYSGVLPATLRAGDNLQAAAKGFFTLLEPSAYPAHTKKQLQSKSYQVSGKKAWLYQLRLDFPQAQSKGWNFTSELATVVVVDRGSSQPATFYISVPSSHPNQGDTNLLLSSLKAT
jgi:hypothetical protein